MIAATGKDGVLYVLDARDLSLRWTVKLAIQCICPECGCGSLSTPAFDGKYLYVGAGAPDPEGYSNGSVYAVDPSTAQVVWRQDLVGAVIAPVTVANGVVFVSSSAGVAGFEAAMGVWLWDDGAYGLIYSQPVVVDGALYTTYFNGDLVSWALTGTDAANSGRAPSILRNNHNHGVKLSPAFRRIKPHR